MVKITMLSHMADDDFLTALDRHVEWEIETLDIKSGVFGKGLMGVSDEEAERAAKEIADRALSVHCLSSNLFFDEVEEGEAVFRKQHLPRVERLIELAQVFRPRFVRLLAAKTARRADFTNCVGYLTTLHPWIFDLYGEAIDQVAAAGFTTAIENETYRCVFSTAEEIVAFFERLDRGDDVCFSWDAQNLWQMGTFPSLDVYRELKPWIGYYHLKGGRTAAGADELVYASTLADASWPVQNITRELIHDGVSPVICLNPSHGHRPDGYDPFAALKENIAFLRDNFEEIE